MSARRTAVLVAAFAMSASAFAVLPAAAVVAAPAHSDVSGVECATDEGSAARVRPGQHAHERNELSQKEVVAAEKEMNARLAGLRGAGTQAVTTVPVVFHVITASGGTGNVTNTQINQQITEMNQNFAGGESSAAANTEFQFTLQAVRRVTNTNWFNNVDTPSVEAAMKSATREGDAGVLNIWSTNTSYLGFATFPSWYAADPELDGVVIQYGSVPGGGITNFNLGKTASHETGHWLGLYHTFQGGCSTSNDQVSDTPAQRTSTSGCPSGKDTCTSAGVDPIHNYMDYSYDSCYNQFTQGQKTRMKNQWAAYRA
ncbi:MAG: zinc metalloprotease [Actinophytocola sp.]|uniref:zinc metalloprotease n=1 Tax=Actinophytocola sp. TaxID=1872138 RepID=UPI003C7345EF